MPSFVRDGLRFHYADSCAGAAADCAGRLPFAFQHGLGGDCSQPFGLFAPPDWLRLICLECRGHGATPLGPEDALGFDTYADDVVALLDHLGIAQAVAGGISMGAGIALDLARRHPARILGLVLIRPAWLDEPMAARPLYQLVAALLREHGAEEGLRRLLDAPEHRALAAEAPSAAQSLADQFKQSGIAATAAKFARLSDDNPYTSAAQIEAISVPTLVIATHHDPVHPYTYGTALAAHIPNAAFVEVTPKTVDEQAYQREVQAALEQFVQMHYT
jgi:pimeloyl-ACP methyl ester carboxylesterase